MSEPSQQEQWEKGSKVYRYGSADDGRDIEGADGAPLCSGNTPSTTSNAPAPFSQQNSHSIFALVGAITLYSGISLGIVYFNWWLFTRLFQYPIFISWVQQVTGLATYKLLSFVPLFAPKLARVTPQYKFEWEIAKHILPLSTSFVGMVGFANICLKYVQISTYQVARSLTLLFTMLFSYVILGDIHTFHTIGACSIIVVGFILNSLDPQTLTLFGLLAGAASSMCQALYNVVIKKTLVVVNGDPQALLFYNLALSSVFFIPLIFALGEYDVFAHLPFELSDPHFWAVWGALFFSGFLATAMNLSSYWCVKVTSPLTFNIVGFSKSVVQTLGGIVFLGDVVTKASLAGVSLSFVGSAWYTVHKSLSLYRSTTAESALSQSAELDEEMVHIVGDSARAFGLKVSSNDKKEPSQSHEVEMSSNPLYNEKNADVQRRF